MENSSSNLFRKHHLDRLYRWIIYSRDDFRCQRCGRKGEISSLNEMTSVLLGNEPIITCDLVIHHINGNRNDDRLENLISLCDECHFEVHNRDWRNKPKENFVTKPVSHEFIEKAIKEYQACQRKIYNKYENILKRIREEELKKIEEV